MPRRKFPGRAVAALLGTVLLAGGALGAAAPALFAWAIERPLSRWTGRSVALEGPIHIRWGTPLRLSADGLHIANAPWAAHPDMVTAQRVALDIRVGALLRGARHIAFLSLENAHVFLETSGQGERNWDFLRDRLRTPAGALAPTLDLLQLRDAIVNVRNAASGRERTMTIAALDLARTPHGLLQLEATGQLFDEPARLTAMAGPFAELRHPSARYPLHIDAALADSHLELDGSIAEPLDLQGVAARMRLLGGAFTAAVPGLADLDAVGDITGNGSTWSLQRLAAHARGGDLEGALSIDLHGPLPTFRGDVTAATLDLRAAPALMPRVAPALAAAKPAAADARVIPALALPPDLFSAVSAQLAFTAGRVITPTGLPLERVSIGLQLTDGRLALDPLRFHLAGGDIDMEATLDVQARPPRFALDLGLAGVDLGALAKQSALPRALDGLTGRMTGVLRLRGGGMTLRDAAAHLDGEAQLTLAGGELDRTIAMAASPELGRALGFRDDETTIPLNCFAARFAVKNGVATTTTLIADTAAATLAGHGDVNLAAETLYVDLTPTEKRPSGRYPSAPLELRGTFAKPMLVMSQAGLALRRGGADRPDAANPPAEPQRPGDPASDEANACPVAAPSLDAPVSGSTVGSGQPAEPRH
jgi:hypothetical protein